jgi:hypothetical protein
VRNDIECETTSETKQKDYESCKQIVSFMYMLA